MIQPLTRAEFLRNIFDFEGLHAPQRQNTHPCVVLFYMNEDVRCSQQIEILESIIPQTTGISFFKVEVMNEQLLAADLGIRRIPALLFVPVKDELRISEGLLPPKQLFSSFQNLFKTKYL